MSISVLRFLWMLFSAATANLISSMIEDPLNSGGQSAEAPIEKRIGWTVLRILVTILVYIIIAALSTTVYAFVKLRNNSFNFWIAWKNVFNYYIWKHFLEFLIIPVITGLFTSLVNLKRRKGIKIVMSVVLSALLLATPFYVQLNDSNFLPMGEEILTELRSIPFPYDGTIHDIFHFSQMIDDGYWLDEKWSPEPETGSNADSSYSYEFRAYPSTLDHYIDNVVFYEKQSDFENSKTWLQKAYEFFLANGQSSDNAIGRMWFYKGRYETPEHFITAAEVFKEIDQNYNAALSFYSYNQDTGITEYAQLAMEYFVMSAAESDNLTDSLRIFKMLVVENFSVINAENYIHEICDYSPNDALLNALDINASIAHGYHRAKDAERIESLLSNAKYEHCPKLLLMRFFCSLSDRLSDKTVRSSSDLYKLYKEYPTFFESEDKVNFAWVLYEDGEYVKAYELALGIDGLFDRDVFLLLKAESYLQNTNALSEIDAEKLYQDICDELENAEIDDKTSSRLRLAQCILAGKLGLDPSYTGISDICLDVFGENSPSGLFIVASLELQDGLYLESMELCDRIIAQIDAPNYFYNKVLFLKADAIIQYANGLKGEEKQEKYKDAELILKAIRENVGNDYIICLQKLLEIYKNMDDRDIELQETTNILMHLQ